MNKEAPLNIHNFKTKPPSDEWSSPYDSALKNTAFMKKIMRAPLCVRTFYKTSSN